MRSWKYSGAPFVSAEITKKHSCFFCTLSCLTMIALFAMRHLSMGIDLHYGHSIGYLASYEQTAEMGWREIFHINHFGYERGYVVFIKLLTYFSSDPRFLLTSIAVITMSCVFSVLASYSDDAFLSVIVYIGTPCFVANFSSLRQALAVSLCFFHSDTSNRKNSYRSPFSPPWQHCSIHRRCFL